MLDLPGELRQRLEQGLAPYARGLIARAAGLALRLHADEVGPEHLLCALMEDEDCAAHRAVVHAFADPETLGEEVRSLAAGIMVTGSAASLPFSEGGVRALEAARHTAAARGEGAVLPAHVLGAALRALPFGLLEEFEDAGFEPARLEESFGPAAVGHAVAEAGALFRAFSEEAKRLLSAAARVARQGADREIGPAHLVLACLTGEPALERSCGVSASRARMLLRGRTGDPTPLPDRALRADDSLADYLAGLPAGACSLGLLARFHAGKTPEIAQLLLRHRVTPALVERARAAFFDPETPAGPGAG